MDLRSPELEGCEGLLWFKGFGSVIPLTHDDGLESF